MAAVSNDYFVSKRPSLSEAATPISPAGTPGSSRPNALSSRVTSVLAASYADLEIRDALSLLDLRKVENTPETRRQLRQDIQRAVIESNGAVIREFGHVAEQLRRIGLTVVSLNEGCEELRKHIAAAHRETAPVLQEASDWLLQKEQVESKQQLLRAFNTHFVMSDDDFAVLTSTAEPVNDHFFTLLTRAKKIQVDCEVLLGTENQRLGQEIMDQTSKNVNGAFQKLYRWIQREFKSLNLENPQISSSIRRALRVLAERPSLFQSCLDFFAQAREHILSDAFYTALTGSTSGGQEDKSVKPIELVAHDPLRYVGDMLAWTHSATVSEHEALEVLFIADGDEIAKGMKAGRENEPWNKYIDDEEVIEFDGTRALKELVDRDIAGVVQVLRQRIGQVIQSHEETIMAYKISNLLSFYRTTFTKLLGHDSTLLEALAELEGSALRQFRVLVREQVSNLQSEVQHAPVDLSPPDFLQDGLKQLTAIMKTYDTSFSTAVSREEEFKPILKEAFEPYMDGSQIMGKTLKFPANAIFAINCMLLARSALSAFEFNIERTLAIEDKMQEYITQLIEYQYAFFLQNLGVFPLLQAIDSLPENSETADIIDLEAFKPHSLIEASQILDDFLPTALMDATENLKQIQSAKLAMEITEEAADRFCEDFEIVEEKLVAVDAILERLQDSQDEEGTSLRALFPRTGGEIRALLT